MMEISLEKWLERIEAKIDGLYMNLGDKADKTLVSQIDARVEDATIRLALLEASSVKREGPIIGQLQALERRMDRIEDGQHDHVEETKRLVNKYVPLVSKHERILS